MNNTASQQQEVEHFKCTQTIVRQGEVTHLGCVCLWAVHGVVGVLSVPDRATNSDSILIVIIHNQDRGALDDWRIFKSLQAIDNHVKQLVKKSKMEEEERQ